MATQTKPQAKPMSAGKPAAQQPRKDDAANRDQKKPTDKSKMKDGSCGC